jgi:uncharacterized membrane protein YfcA
MDFSPLAPWLYPLLFLTGLVAGFVDSIAGGGGLITIPVLLNIGLPPGLALGTNKLQATFGSGSAAWHFWRAGLIDWSASRIGVVYTLVGATAGTLLVSFLPAAVLRAVIPWLLIGISLYLILQPKVGDADRRARMRAEPFYALFGLGLGFYDGFFGPGTGTFWAMAFMLALGFNLMRATAHTKLMNFTSNVSSLVVFLVAGQCHLLGGLCMGCGQMIGARLGSTVVIRKGSRFIRPIFVSVAIAITLRLLWVNFSATQ